MRLLKREKSGRIELESFNDDHLPPYAILSHTWIDGQEVIFAELEACVRQVKTGWHKINFCIDRAEADGLEYCWVDTCCIDKSSSAELSTAVNSMFRYYQNAAKCYVYLSDVHTSDEAGVEQAVIRDHLAHTSTGEDDVESVTHTFDRRSCASTMSSASISSGSDEDGMDAVTHKRTSPAHLPEPHPGPSLEWRQAFQRSRWFTRGWTLQELLAPSTLEFFSAEGKLLGNKSSLVEEVHKITRVPMKALRGQDLAEFSVEERLSWAAGRNTTRREDKVYCLLGIFGVFLSLIYGEGEEYAALRLEDEIQKHRERQRRPRLLGLSSAAQPVMIENTGVRNSSLDSRKSFGVRSKSNATEDLSRSKNGWSESHNPAMTERFSILDSRSSENTKRDVSKNQARVASRSRTNRYDGREQPLSCRLADRAAQARVVCIAFSSDGTQLATGSADHIVRLWSISTGRILQGLTSDGVVAGIAFSNDSKNLVSASANGSVTAWDVTSGECKEIHKESASTKTGDCLPSLTSLPNNRGFAYGKWDGTVIFWHTWASMVILSQCTVKDHRDCVTDLVFSPDSKWLASSGLGEGVTIRKVAEDGRLLQPRKIGCYERFDQRIAFSPDSKRVASTGRCGTIRICAVESGKVYQDTSPIEAPGHERDQSLDDGLSAVKALCFSSDSIQLLTVSALGTLRVYQEGATQQHGFKRDLQKVRQVQSGYRWPAAIAAIAISPSSKKIACAVSKSVEVRDISDI